MLFPSIDGVWRSSVLACTYRSSAVFQTLIDILLADLMLSKLHHLSKGNCNIPKWGINQIFHLGSLMKNNNALENSEVIWVFFLFCSLVLEDILTCRSYSTVFLFLTLKGCDCSLRKTQVYAAIPNLSQGGGSFISILFLLFSFSVMHTHKKLRSTLWAKLYFLFIATRLITVMVREENEVLCKILHCRFWCWCKELNKV